MASQKKQDITDEKILADVKETLEWDGRVEATGVEPSVTDGVVELRGMVPNFTSRAAAVEQVRLTPGVREVRDHLAVRVERSIHGVDDESLTERARKVLDWDSDLGTADLRVRSHDGTLEVNGIVNAHWKIGRATDLLRRIRGVQGVVNNLAVVPSDDVGDESLALRITKALRRNALVDADPVEIEVRNGVVTLTGLVPSWMEADTIRDLVSNTPGTVKINDLLETEMEPAPA